MITTDSNPADIDDARRASRVRAAKKVGRSRIDDFVVHGSFRIQFARIERGNLRTLTIH